MDNQHKGASSGSLASMDSADPRDSLWVKAPEFQGWLYKKGFRFRRKWVRRWVVLSNREVTYYEKEPPADLLHRHAFEGRGTVSLQRDLQVLTKGLPSSSSKGPLDLVLYPGGGEPPWELRAETLEDKEAWVFVLQRCVTIASWLVQFKMGGLLGVGAAAVVREVRNKATGEKFALKIVTIHDPRMRAVAVQEVEVLQRVTEVIKHRNLAVIKKVYQSADKLLIAMPLCSGGELYERIASLKRFTELDAAAAVYRVLSALKALHTADPPILHLDVKPENLLYESSDADAELIVTDFGLARVVEGAADLLPASASSAASAASANNKLSEGGAMEKGGAAAAAAAANNVAFEKQRRQRMVGTVGYMAPEVIRDRHYSPAADVFSTGVVLYTLLVGYPPFPGREDHEVLSNTVRGHYRLDPKRGWGEVSAEAQDLVRSLLDPNPHTRITTSDALANSWLARGRPWTETELEEQLARFQGGAGVGVGEAAAVGEAAGGGQKVNGSSAAAFLEAPPPSSSTAPTRGFGLASSPRLGPSAAAAPPPRHLSSAAQIGLAGQLPVLRSSQDSLREFNEQRVTVRLSRAAEFVLNLDPALLEGGAKSVSENAVGGAAVTSGGAGSLVGGLSLSGGGGASSSSSPSLSPSFSATLSASAASSAVINMQAPEMRKRVDRAFRLLSPFNGGKLNPTRFQLMARVVDGGHWPHQPLFAFFDRDRDGLVSPEDFTEAQALIRTRSPDFLYLLFQAYLAQKLPPPPAGAGVAAAEVGAKAAARRKATATVAALKQRLVAASVLSAGALAEEPHEEGLHRGGDGGEEDPDQEEDGDEDDEDYFHDVRGTLSILVTESSGGDDGVGDELFGGSSGATQGVSPGMLQGMRTMDGGGGGGNRQRSGTVDMRSAVTREHVRAMFRARLAVMNAASRSSSSKGGGGSSKNEGGDDEVKYVKAADEAFDAAVEAVFGDLTTVPSQGGGRLRPGELRACGSSGSCGDGDGDSSSSSSSSSSTTSLQPSPQPDAPVFAAVTALDSPGPSLAGKAVLAGSFPSPPNLVDAAPPITPEEKRDRGSNGGGGGGGGGGLVAESPSQVEWESRMGDLLPTNMSKGFGALAVSDTETGGSQPAAAVAVAAAGEREEVELRFPHFRRAALAVPLLCEIMLMETRTHAMRYAVGGADRSATPLVDSVIREDKAK